jgi:hypothetical protein
MDFLTKIKKFKKMKKISVGDVVIYRDAKKRFEIDDYSFEKVIVVSVNPVVLIDQSGEHFWGNLNIDELFSIGEADVDVLKNSLTGVSRMFLSRELWKKTVVRYLAEYGSRIERSLNFDPKEVMEGLENGKNLEELKHIALEVIPKLTKLKTINYISEKIDEITKIWGQKHNDWKKHEK